MSSGITYHGRILKPDGTPLNGSQVQFKIQIRSPGSENCLLYEELQTQNLSTSNGVFSITINDGSGQRTDSSGYGLDTLLANRGAFTLPAGTCTNGTTYIPNSSDGRALSVQFRSETMAQWELLPTQAVNFSPFAIEAKQIGGYTPNNLLRVDDTAASSNTTLLNTNQLSSLISLVSGTSTQYVMNSGTSGAAVPTFSGAPGTLTAGSMWYDTSSSQLKYYNGTAVMTVGGGGSTGNYSFSGNILTTAAGDPMTIVPGAASSATSNGNALALQGGPGGATSGAGGTVVINGGTPTAGAGGGVNITAANGVGTNQNGGTVTLTAGTATGSGTAGVIALMGGNVGVGTTSPVAKLNISGAGAQVYDDSFGTSNNPGFIGRFARGTQASPTAAQANDTLNFIGARGYGATVMGGNSSASIGFYAAENFTDTALGGYLTLNTQPTGTAGGASERVRVTASGAVGISSSNPQALLDVGNGQIFNENFGVGGNPGYFGRFARGSQGAPTAAQANDTLNFIGGRGYGTTGFAGGSSAGIMMVAGENFTDTAQGGYMTFNTQANGSANAIAERMRITASGNIGIGTTSPRAALDVSGGTILGPDPNSISNGTGASGSPIDFSKGNLQQTTTACSGNTVYLTNMTAGGSYNLLINSTTQTGSCTFVVTGTASNINPTLTFLYKGGTVPVPAATGRVMYTFLVFGTGATTASVYVSVVDGLQ